MRDIMPGEEVTHSCMFFFFVSTHPSNVFAFTLVLITTTIDVTLGRTSKERKHILDGWGFNCSCWLCTASPAEINASDSRRERVYDIHASLAESYEGDSEYVLDEESIDALSEELFALIEEEQLWPQLVVFYEVIARAYMEIAEWDSARKYVALAEQRWNKYGGEDHDNVDGIRALWAELKERASAQ